MTGWKAWAKLASIAIDLGINAATLAAIVAAIAGSALSSGGAGAVAVGVAAAGKLVDSAVRGSYEFVMLVTGIVCMIKDGAYIYTEVTLDNSNEVIDAIINFPIIEPT